MDISKLSEKIIKETKRKDYQHVVYEVVDYLYLNNYLVDTESRPVQAGVSMQKAGLIWDTEDGESERSKLLGQKTFDMKCNHCLTFIGSVAKPSLLEYNFCPNCGRKLIKDGSFLSK